MNEGNTRLIGSLLYPFSPRSVPPSGPAPGRRNEWRRDERRAPRSYTSRVVSLRPAGRPEDGDTARREVNGVHVKGMGTEPPTEGPKDRKVIPDPIDDREFQE